MEMDPTHYNPLDSQPFDLLQCTRTRLISLFNTSTSKRMMGQGLCIRTERVSVGDVWPYHKVAVDPLSDLEESCPSSSSTSTTDMRATSPMPADGYDHDDIVVMRTIIRPNSNSRCARTLSHMQMVLTRMFSRLPSPTSIYSPSPLLSASPRSTPPSRPVSLVLQALNCFSTSSAVDSDVDDKKMHRRERPVLVVIVKQTKERYEDDRAFKETVASVCPQAAVSVRGGV